MKSNVNRQTSEKQSELESRHVAAELLCLVINEQLPLDVCMSRSQSYQGLTHQDKAFGLRLMQQYLRHYGQSEHTIAALLHKPLHEQLTYVHVQIGLAMVQIQSMNIPPYAAVNTAVELTKRVSESHAGVVNAILNKWIKEHQSRWLAEPIANIPVWLQERWGSMYGIETITHIAQILTQEPSLDLTFKQQETKQQWVQQHPDIQAMCVGDTLRLKQAGQVSELDGFKEGHWWIQDVAASLPVYLMGDIAGENVLDMCAAPGGKTMQLAARGAKVMALDSSKKRLQIVQENLARTQSTNVELIAIDALKYTPDTPPDVILLDAPCSATGTMRRNPDILLIRSAKNLFEQLEKQKKLLAHAAEILPPGGILVYAVCSLEPEEGEMQIEHLLKSRTDICVDIKKTSLPLEVGVGSLGLRTLPNMQQPLGGMDGFFMTRLRKI